MCPAIIIIKRKILRYTFNRNNFINDYQKFFHEKDNKNYILYWIKKIPILPKCVLLYNNNNNNNKFFVTLSMEIILSTTETTKTFHEKHLHSRETNIYTVIYRNAQEQSGN